MSSHPSFLDNLFCLTSRITPVGVPAVDSPCTARLFGPSVPSITLTALNVSYVLLHRCWYERCINFFQDCGEVVASKFFHIVGPKYKQQPLCERDYFRRIDLLCARCNMALRGSYITACGMLRASLVMSQIHLNFTFRRQEIPRWAFHMLCLCDALWPPGFIL